MVHGLSSRTVSMDVAMVTVTNVVLDSVIVMVTSRDFVPTTALSSTTSGSTRRLVTRPWVVSTVIVTSVQVVRPAV